MLVVSARCLSFTTALRPIPGLGGCSCALSPQRCSLNRLLMPTTLQRPDLQCSRPTRTSRGKGGFIPSVTWSNRQTSDVRVWTPCARCSRQCASMLDASEANGKAASWQYIKQTRPHTGPVNLCVLMCTCYLWCGCQNGHRVVHVANLLTLTVLVLTPVCLAYMCCMYIYIYI